MKDSEHHLISTHLSVAWIWTHIYSIFPLDMTKEHPYMYPWSVPSHQIKGITPAIISCLYCISNFPLYSKSFPSAQKHAIVYLILQKKNYLLFILQLPFLYCIITPLQKILKVVVYTVYTHYNVFLSFHFFLVPS